MSDFGYLLLFRVAQVLRRRSTASDRNVSTPTATRMNSRPMTTPRARTRLSSAVRPCPSTGRPPGGEHPLLRAAGTATVGREVAAAHQTAIALATRAVPPRAVAATRRPSTGASPSGWPSSGRSCGRSTWTRTTWPRPFLRSGPRLAPH